MSWWNLYLRWLGHSQNSIELSWLILKKRHSSLRIAVVWNWNGCDLLSKIFFTAWIESVTTMIFDMFSLMQAWLIPHLIANNSASILVTNAAWWTVLIRGQFAECTWDIDIAILFLILASVTTRAIDGEEERWRTILSSSWKHILSFSFLLAKLKEKQFEKLSVIQEPGANSGWKGEKEGKIL